MEERQTDSKEGFPKVHSEKCPVCNGFGTLKYGEIVCHACKGKGYIIVPNEIEREKYENKDYSY
jgi:DnaJ-class molecular chaperone